jgi:hypothetical protein
VALALALNLNRQIFPDVGSFPIVNEMSQLTLNFRLSALLAEATLAPQYIQAATESATFIHAHLMNVLNEVQDSISVRKNDSCEANEIVAPYNSGLMIEGLSILYSITQNATVENL